MTLIKNIAMYPNVDYFSYHKFSSTISQYYINSLRDYTNILY